MEPKTLIISGLLICLAAYGGFTYGKAQQEEYFELIEQLEVSGVESSLRMKVQVLSDIEEQNYSKAKRILHGFLDNDLSYLNYYYSQPQQEPNQFTLESIKKLRIHREKFNNHKVAPPLADGVAQIFKLTE